MEKLGNILIKLAQEESKEEFALKEPLVWDSKRFEVRRYSEYIPMCNPDSFYSESRGYLLSDGCSGEFFINDRVKCSIFYDRLAAIKEGHTVESFDDALRFVRKMANLKFMEIWDDEEEQEAIDMVKEMAEAIGQKIEADNLLEK